MMDIVSSTKTFSISSLPKTVMNFIVFQALILLTILSNSVAQERKLRFFSRLRGLRSRRIRHDGLRRRFLEHKPDNFDGKTVVIVLHGYSQSMWTIFRQRGTKRWLQVSDENGFLLLAPNRHRRRQGWNDLRKETEGSDDVGFLTSLVQWAKDERGIKNVLFSGASNGGIMTYTMLLQRPDLIDAAAVFIANLPVGDFVATTPTPLFLMHGSKDPLHLPQGGQIGRNRGQARSARDTLNFWLDANQVNAASGVNSTYPDDSPGNSCRIEIERYEEGSASVIYYTMVGGGHVYPVKGQDRSSRIVQRLFGPPCGDAWGVELAWDFLSAFVV